MSTVAHFFMIIVAQKFVITWLTFSLTFTTATLALSKSTRRATPPKNSKANISPSRNDSVAGIDITIAVLSNGIAGDSERSGNLPLAFSFYEEHMPDFL